MGNRYHLEPAQLAKAMLLGVQVSIPHKGQMWVYRNKRMHALVHKGTQRIAHFDTVEECFDAVINADALDLEWENGKLK
jgi:hypothetical protein